MTSPATDPGRASLLKAPLRELFRLEDMGFNEVPADLRRYYRYWSGQEDMLGPNEILCPVCHVVLRSALALRAGDELHCLPCLSSLLLVAQDDLLVAIVKPL